MKRSISNSFIAVLILIAAGCASKRTALPSVPEKRSETAAGSKAETLERINAAALQFSTISLKAKTDLAINNQKNDVTLSIRIKRDEAIWVSVTALAGLEVARALITPDSIKILNRIDAEYTRKPFTYVQQFSNDQLNFGMLQSILVGNPIRETLSENAQMVTNPALRLSGALETLIFDLAFSDSNKLLEATLKDGEAGQTLTVRYGDFGVVGAKEVPQSVSIRSQAGNKTIAAELRYTKIDLDVSVEMPFNVPGRFTIKN